MTRVIDQEPEFLRFIERCDLTPGREITVESRDLAADAVRLTNGAGQEVTIGARAAAKVLVQGTAR